MRSRDRRHPVAGRGLRRRFADRTPTSRCRAGRRAGNAATRAPPRHPNRHRPLVRCRSSHHGRRRAARPRGTPSSAARTGRARPDVARARAAAVHDTRQSVLCARSRTRDGPVGDAADRGPRHAGSRVVERGAGGPAGASAARDCRGAPGDRRARTAHGGARRGRTWRP